MPVQTPASPMLPPWAFVVQFRVETDLAQGCCTGRVEHVVSGQAAHFQSLEELLAFIARVLKRCAPSRPTNPSGRAAGRRGHETRRKEMMALECRNASYGIGHGQLLTLALSSRRTEHSFSPWQGREEG